MITNFRMTVAAATLALVSAVPASAGSISVSANGVDSGTCGTGSEAPCATISQAVTNASDGDSIQVGPGAYAGTTVAKSVSLTSSAGGGAAVITSAMTLAASGIEFGKKGKGFSLQGAGGMGTLLSISGDEISVRGNYFSDCTIGIEVTSGIEASLRDNSFDACTTGIGVVSGTGTIIRGNRFGYSGSAAIDLLAGSQEIVVRENRAFGPSGSGVRVSGTGHLVFRNVAHGCPAGGFVSGSTAPADVTFKENLVVSASSPGFYLTTGSGYVLIKNGVVNNNAPGFYLSAATPAVLMDNVAVGGSSDGFQVIGGPDHVMDGNSAVNNGGAGILLGSVGTGVTVTGGNLYGNTGANCGLTNSSASAVTTADVYWGDPAGPGADPADVVCGNVAAVIIDSVAADEQGMKMPSIK